MEFVRPGSGNSIHRILGELADAPLSYSEVGMTLTGEQAEGYRHDRYQAILGGGRTTFEKASGGLKTWRAHRVPGVDVLPHGTVVRTGAMVVVTLGIPLLALAAPCRVVGVLDEPNRWGFAYGTLPGHPEQGEESFVVSIDEDGTVTFRVTAFSRSGDRITRLLGPVGRSVQTAGTKGYLRALKRFVEMPS
jgi:uncharacterized protein (UPF0548 family)